MINRAKLKRYGFLIIVSTLLLVISLLSLVILGLLRHGVYRDCKGNRPASQYSLCINGKWLVKD